jgi:hypothetical protein
VSEDAVRRAEEQLARTRHAASRAEGLRQQLDRERATCTALARQLVEEERDVEQLEQRSIRSVIASIRGRLDEDLDVERAEATAVRLELAAHENVVRSLTAALLDAESLAQTQHDARAELDRALAATEAQLLAEGDPRSGRLREIAALVDGLHANGVEIDEAIAAAFDAIDRVDRTLEALASAKSWSTYDTFFGGGMIASAVKHQRLDDAIESSADVHAALLRLRAELADVAVETGTNLVDVPSTTLRGLDIWFDNIFTDAMVHGRIANSIDRLRDVRAGLDRVLDELRLRRGAGESQLTQLADERRALLAR